MGRENRRCGGWRRRSWWRSWGCAWAGCSGPACRALALFLALRAMNTKERLLA